MIKKILLFLLILFIVIVVGGYFYINKVFIPQNLKPIVIKAIEEATGKSVSIVKAEYFPMKGFSFTEVKIMNDDNTSLLSVREITLKLKSFPKINKDMVVANAKLFIKEVSFNLPPLALKGDCIIDAIVNAKNKSQPEFKASVELNNIEIKGIQPVADVSAINGVLNITEKTFSTEKMKVDIGGDTIVVDLKGGFDKNNVSFNPLNIGYGKTTAISIIGKVSNFKNPQAQVQLNTNVDLGNIAQLVPGITLPLLSGICNVKGDLSGAVSGVEGLDLKAKISMLNASVDKIKFGPLNVDVVLKEGLVNIPTFDCGFYDGKVEGIAQAKVFEADLPLEASVDISGINIATLLKDIAEYDVGDGKVDAHAEVSGSGSDLNTLAGSGWIKMLDARIKVPEKLYWMIDQFNISDLSTMLISEASATFSMANGKLETQDALVLADKAKFAAQGYYALLPYLDFKVKMELSPEIKASLGVGGAINPQVRYSGTPPHDLKAKILASEVIQEAAKEIIKEKGSDFLKEILGGGNNEGENSKSPNPQDILKGLFGK